jgi:hypothetical protein
VDDTTILTVPKSSILVNRGEKIEDGTTDWKKQIPHAVRQTPVNGFGMTV